MTSEAQQLKHQLRHAEAEVDAAERHLRNCQRQLDAARQNLTDKRADVRDLNRRLALIFV